MTKIKSITVVDAFNIMPLYEGSRNEDGEIPILNHPHGWMLFAEVPSGRCYYQSVGDLDSGFTPADKERLEKLVKPIESAGEIDTSKWRTFPYCSYGSPAWQEEDQRRAWEERQGRW